MRKAAIRIGFGKEQKAVECPPALFEMADRLAREHMQRAMHGDAPMREVLGTIYLMGFMHAFQAMDVPEKRAKSKPKQSRMTPAELRSIGESLYGKDWKKLLAAELPCSVRLVNHWLAKTRKIQPMAEARIRALWALQKQS